MQSSAHGVNMRVVLDVGPIIHLSWIDRLYLLDALFEEILLPLDVREEILAPSAEIPGIEAIRTVLNQGWLWIHPTPLTAQPITLPDSLGKGEKGAILVTLDSHADLPITDDAAARATAQAAGLAVTGTLGVLKATYESGHSIAVLPLVLELRRRGQWISDGLIAIIRHEEQDRRNRDVE